jgi:hypothetical protein
MRDQNEELRGQLDCLVRKLEEVERMGIGRMGGSNGSYRSDGNDGSYGAIEERLIKSCGELREETTRMLQTVSKNKKEHIEIIGANLEKS